MMDLKDKYLDRIADALEEQMGVSPKLISGNVLKPNIYRIADALDPEPTPLNDGTLKNPLARIAEVIESGGFGGSGRNVIEGDTAPDNSIGSDYDFYTYKNNVYVKMNGLWKYAGIYNSELLPYIPDGVSVDRKYYILKNKNETAFNKYTNNDVTITNLSDTNCLLFIPTISSTLPSLEDESNDIYSTTAGNFFYGILLSKNMLTDSYISISKSSGASINNIDIYEHNNYISTISSCLLKAYVNNNLNNLKARLIPDGTKVLQEYTFVNDVTSMTRYDNTKNIIRLVDDTVIQAFHQFVLN